MHKIHRGCSVSCERRKNTCEHKLTQATRSESASDALLTCKYLVKQVLCTSKAGAQVTLNKYSRCSVFFSLRVSDALLRCT